METSLTLYVVGGTPASDRSLAALQRLRASLPSDAVIDVIDVADRPEVAEAERIIATPMLVRASPPPVRRLIGDLSDLGRVRAALGLEGND
jgi:circadian clock protein KaiB